MVPSQEQITEAVLAFVNAQTWAESKRIVEDHRDVLLTEAVDEVFVGLLTQYKDNDDTTRILEEHRTLLARCRREGIDAAFADLVAPGGPSAAVTGLLAEIVLAFVNAQTWAESRQIVEDHRHVLLTDAADEVLVTLLEQYRDDENATRQLEDLRRLLLRCRQEGIDAVFADRLHPLAALEVVETFITADTWAESKQIVEAHSELLLADAADAVLAELLTQYGDDEDAARTLEEHRALLLRCRREGIEAAFASLTARTNSPAAAQESLGEIVLAFVKSQTLSEKNQIVEAHRDVLLTDVADAFFADWLADTDDEDFTRILESHRTLLLRCRREGIDAAFVNRLDPPAEVRESELSALLDELVQLTKPNDMPRAVAVCQAALELVSRDGQPELWAALQVQLGNTTLAQNLLAEQEDHIEKAIHHYKQALEAYTREDFPERWAMTQNNLGEVYRNRNRGDRAENLEQAIRHYEQALMVYTREELPERWAMIQNNLASAYQNRIRGNRAKNLERVIHEYQQALEVYTREGFPERWAMTQNNLADAYQNRIRGDRAENIERAIRHCQRALKVYTRQDFPERWAATQNKLASAYCKRIRGKQAENIERAIHHFEQTLEVRTREALPEHWAETQNNLGASYQDRIQGKRAENLEEAIEYCQQALEVRTRQEFPEDWATTQNNLANAYNQRIRGEWAENLEQAIHHYRQALEVYTQEDFPIDWAATQNSLAVAYQNRIRGDGAGNLERAIYHCEQALKIYTQVGFSERWAMTQNTLGEAYRNRIRDDRAENIERAIRHYQQALEVYTRQAFPVDWAGTQDNLASAYQHRIRGDRAENIERAIHHYEQALEVRTREALPTDWAITQNSLASAYHNRIQGNKAENLERAIRHFQQALEVRTRQDFPQDWAMTQNNLAVAYSNRIRGERAKNLEEAIDHYQQALKIYTREDFPERWATTQNNLATVYIKRIREKQAENIEENIEQAIYHFRQALEIRTAKAFPQNCLNTAYVLGNLLYYKRRFPEARTAFTTGHEAVEALRGEIQREGAIRELSEENANLYARLVHCCLLEGDEKAAFEYAVAGKGRAFVDMLATARFDLSAAGADDPELAEDLRQAKELRQQIDNLLAQLSGDGPTIPDGTKRHSLREMRPDLRALQDQEAAFWEDMSYKYPALTATQQAPAFTAEEARVLAKDPKATLVEYYRHAGGWCAFVVTPDSLRYVPLPEVSDDRMESLFDDWLECIESSRGRNKLSYGPLRRLHKALISPLRSYLPPGGAVVLAPFAWLHLLPLGAALDPKTGRYAADDYRLAFTPSLAALRVARDQSRQGASSTGRASFERLLSVAYPGDDPQSKDYLESAVEEAEAISGHFAPQVREELYEDAATPNAVLAHARGRDVIHLSCHGWFDPEAPEQSGLILSGGWLTVQRVITELRLEQTQLVTVSACSSGRAQIRQGEEHVGLLQAIMSAGARMVVASLWSVDEASTQILFETFYEKRAAGIPPADALAEAARSVRSDPAWEHPYYWAAFQASGLAYEANGPTSAQRPAEVEKRIGETPQKSKQKRGGSVVEAEKMVKESLILLKQMAWDPDEVRETLDRAGQREKVVEELRALAEQADGIEKEADLLAVADAVHQLVENTALVDLFPPEVDVEAAREERKKTITERYHVAASHKSQRVQKDAGELVNRMIEVIRGLDQPAAQVVLEGKDADVLEGGSADER